MCVCVIAKIDRAKIDRANENIFFFHYFDVVTWSLFDYMDRLASLLLFNHFCSINLRFLNRSLLVHAAVFDAR